MQKIAILENLEFLALKIQKILIEHGYDDVSIIHATKKYNTNIYKELEEANFIIADLDNPTFDPLELIKKNNKEIPIIFLSDTGDFVKIKQVIEAGGKDFLLKPFETELLISKIAKISIGDENIARDVKEWEIFPETKIPLEWNEGFELGVSQIDNEHKSIIENYRRLYDEMRAGGGLNYYPEMLVFLQNYIETHFRNEEILQKKNGYKEYEQHKEMHENFSEKIRKYIEKEKIEGAKYSDLVTFSLYIKDWLIHHILIEDRKIGKCIKNSEIM